ncbi:MAG TPA: hypothetical protein VE398_12020 [Acidobacteriota bacterium]|nr:hypothetical protein [Acidobacteriota bacterium]
MWSCAGSHQTTRAAAFSGDSRRSDDRRLAAAACALGLGFASATAPVIVNGVMPAENPADLDLHLDWRVLAFVVLVGLSTTALLFEVKPSDFSSLAFPLACMLAGSALAALGPTLRVARTDPIAALRYE